MIIMSKKVLLCLYDKALQVDVILENIFWIFGSSVMRKSNFQNSNVWNGFWIWIPCKKTVNAKCLSFLIYWLDVVVKWQKLSKIVQLFLCLKYHCSEQNIEKRKGLCIDTFLQGIQICNQYFKIPILKFWSYKHW